MDYVTNTLIVVGVLMVVFSGFTPSGAISKMGFVGAAIVLGAVLWSASMM